MSISKRRWFRGHMKRYGISGDTDNIYRDLTGIAERHGRWTEDATREFFKALGSGLDVEDALFVTSINLSKN